jgi:hypothetical protein
MQERQLSIPKLIFIAGTRALLGAGVALLASRRMSDKTRLTAGIVLAVIGAVSTVPAARLVIHAGSSRPQAVASPVT